MNKMLTILNVWFFSAVLAATSGYTFEETPLPKARTIMPKARTTAQGINTWLVSDPDTAMVSIVISFKNGWLYDPEGKEGSAALYTQLMFKDRVEYKFQNIIEMLQKIGGSFKINEDPYHLFVKIKFPYMYLTQAKNLFTKFFTNTNFTWSAFEKQRNDLSGQSGISYRSAGSLAYQLLYKKLYPKHIFANLGNEICKGISAISLEEMRQYSWDNFAKDQMHVTAVGHINEQELEELLNDSLNKLPKNSQKELEFSAPTAPSVPGIFHIEKQEEQSSIRFGVRCVAPNHPQWMSLAILTDIFGSGASGRLFTTMRTKLGLVYGASSHIENLSNEEAFIYGGFNTKKENTQKSIASLLTIIQDIHQNGVSLEEFEEAKKSINEELTLSMTSVSASAQMLEGLYHRGYGPNALEELKTEIQQVTLEDVNLMAQQYFSPEKFTIVCVGPVKPLAFSDSIKAAQPNV